MAWEKYTNLLKKAAPYLRLVLYCHSKANTIVFFTSEKGVEYCSYALCFAYQDPSDEIVQN